MAFEQLMAEATAKKEKESSTKHKDKSHKSHEHHKHGKAEKTAEKEKVPME